MKIWGLFGQDKNFFHKKIYDFETQTFKLNWSPGFWPQLHRSQFTHNTRYRIK